MELSCLNAIFVGTQYSKGSVSCPSLCSTAQERNAGKKVYWGLAPKWLWIRSICYIPTLQTTHSNIHSFIHCIQVLFLVFAIYSEQDGQRCLLSQSLHSNMKWRPANLKHLLSHSLFSLQITRPHSIISHFHMLVKTLIYIFPFWFYSFYSPCPSAIEPECNIPLKDEADT